jgi:hypothetical protein
LANPKPPDVSACRDFTQKAGLYFHGDRPSTIDATLLGALATAVLTPVQSPIRDFLRSQGKCMAYAERMMESYFPEMMASRR